MADFYLDWWCAFDSYLTMQHRDDNALRVMAYFRRKGWSDQAIAGLCGNMWVESSINPWLYEGTPSVQPYPPENWVKGFGLTQWTNSDGPPHKFIGWAIERGFDWKSGWVQCYRIYRESILELQWEKKSKHDKISFEDWTHKTDWSIDKMTECFKDCYERGGRDLATRQQYANYYYNELIEGPDLPPVPPDPGAAGVPPIWLLFKMRRRKNGQSASHGRLY